MLTEQKILAEVAIHHDTDQILVRWQEQILRNGEVISSVPHRKAYSKYEKENFSQEVEGAEKYLSLTNW
jgi:hypothetical protein